MSGLKGGIYFEKAKGDIIHSYADEIEKLLLRANDHLPQFVKEIFKE
jgi:hypothetical protein